MKFRVWVICFLAAGLLFYLAGCKKANLFDSADGSLTGHSGCKDVGKSSVSDIGVPVQTEQECIAYQYDGEDILLVYHTNSVLNCCPEQILAEISFSTGLISISEREQVKGCKCLCFYDISYRLSSVFPEQPCTIADEIAMFWSNEFSQCFNILFFQLL